MTTDAPAIVSLPQTGGRRLFAFVTAVLLVTSVLAGVTLSVAQRGSATSADPVVGLAGDIACDPASTEFNGGAGTADACQQVATSNLLMDAGVSAVLPLGDTQYEVGTAAQFAGAYDPSWGRLLANTHPVVGNHEYQTASASGYFNYFGAAAGDPRKGYYSYNIGAWHFIALNSNCSIVSCANNSTQEKWLKQDLANNTGKCIAAYWHHPRFSSGYQGDNSTVAPFWNDLYAAHADLVLNGHEHHYERYAPQSPAGAADAFGIRQLIVGTGGEDHHPFPGAVEPLSQAHDANTFGVGLLTLHATGYDFNFEPVAGGTFTDSVAGTCHAFATAPGAPTSVAATAGNGSAGVSWTPPASDGGAGITSYVVTSSPGGITTTVTGSSTFATVAGLTNGTQYTFTVKAKNAVGTGPASSPSNAVTPSGGITPSLTNAGFESGSLAPWSSAGTTSVVTIPHTGTYAEQGGSTSATNGDSSVTQTFTLPATATTLSFWYKVTCPDTVQYDWATATLKDNTTGTTTTVLPKTCSNTGSWAQASTNVSAIAGHSVTLTLTSHDDNYASDPTRTVFDDVTIGSSSSTVPGAPTGVSASAGNASANVTWTPPGSNGGSAITSYTITSTPATAPVSVSGSATSASVTGLTNGTSYTFQVTAANTNGSGPASSPSNAVVPSTVPGAPTNVTAVAGDSSATVSWTAPSNGGSALIGYTVTATSGGASVQAAANATSATVTGLTNDTTYTFTVTAKNANGEGDPSTPSNAVTPTAAPLSPITNGGYETGSLSGWTSVNKTSVSTTAHSGSYSAQDGLSTPTSGDSSVVQTFTSPASGGTLSFWYRMTCPDTVSYDWATATLKDNVTGTTATLLPRTCSNNGAWVQVSSSLSAVAGHSVTLTLTSHDDNYAGDASYTMFDDVTVTPTTAPGAPTGVSATAGDGSASVSWVPPASDGGSPVTAYVVTSSGGQSTTANASATSAVVSGLTNGVSYTFTVTAKNVVGAGPPSAASNAVTPTAAPAAGVVNGGFESGFTAWSTAGTTALVWPAHTGSYAGQLGSGNATNGDSSVAQTFTVPSTGGTLSFWYKITCPDTVQYDWATVTLRDNTTGTTTTVLPHTCTNGGAWVQATASVSAMAGHNVTLTLVSHDDNYVGDGTYTQIDDIAIV